jgi:hypothetical protein
MSNDAPDPMLDRAINELRRLPALDPVAIRRIVNAAAEARVSPADEPVFVGRSTGRSMRIWSAIGLAAAAAIAGFFVRGAFTTKAPVQTVATAAVPTTASESLRPVASSSAESNPILQQFVFENTHASHVAVVGDFNKWNPGSSPMQRSADGATWSVTIPIVPGRHIFGYMVDDSLFTLDPRAPKVRDPDLGTEGSVVIVGRP